MWVRYDYRDVVNTLVTEGIVGEKTYRSYLHRVVRNDIEKQLSTSTEEMECVVLLEQLKVMYETEVASGSDKIRLTEVRQQLSKLKSKYRRQLNSQRKQLMKQWE